MTEQQIPTGFFRKYVFSSDHKVIGIQYLVTAMIMAIVGGALAIIIRIQLTWPDQAVVRAETYLSLVTMHGTLMIFFVVWLALVSGLGHIVIPLMVGARNMAWPVLGTLSFWTVAVACLLMLWSLAVEGGAAASGWTSYPPLSTLEAAVPGSGFGQSLWLWAMLLFIVSFALAGVSYLVTILKRRADGLSMMRLPLMIWSLLISVVLGMLAFPTLAAAIVMLLLDRHSGTSFFMAEDMIVGDAVLPNQGGAPLLFQHLFWFMGHPATYVVFLPAVGIAFEVIATFARRPPFGYRLSVFAFAGTALLSLIVWGQHMFVSGINASAATFFSIAAVLIALPVAVLVLNLMASLWRGRIRFETPMLFALGMISAIVIGGLGGACMSIAASNIHFHESNFVVGHLHFMIGTVTFFGIFAGVYYWFPKMFGRMMSDRLGKTHFWLTMVPMFAMFILMHYQGLGGSLRRFYDPTSFEFMVELHDLDLPISIFGFTAVAAQILFLANFGWSVFRGTRADRNPWRAPGLEWSAESPAPPGNWGDKLPVIRRGAYECDDPDGKPSSTHT